jgi:hypothetical protein
LVREQRMLDKAKGLANMSSEKSHLARHSRVVRVAISECWTKPKV